MNRKSARTDGFFTNTVIESDLTQITVQETKTWLDYDGGEFAGECYQCFWLIPEEMDQAVVDESTGWSRLNSKDLLPGLWKMEPHYL